MSNAFPCYDVNIEIWWARALSVKANMSGFFNTHLNTLLGIKPLSKKLGLTSRWYGFTLVLYLDSLQIARHQTGKISLECHQLAPQILQWLIPLYFVCVGMTCATFMYHKCVQRRLQNISWTFWWFGRGWCFYVHIILSLWLLSPLKLKSIPNILSAGLSTPTNNLGLQQTVSIDWALGTF